jgi:hypothetical protein
MSLNEGELTAALYFRQLEEIDSMKESILKFTKSNKKLLKANPWLGQLHGLARKAKAVVVRPDNEEEKVESRPP